ncbi:MAG: Photosynthesis system assembly factor [Frankiales bacterium]|nr:Photosynthesis system assembly factor [Frankiales bacterium]
MTEDDDLRARLSPEPYPLSPPPGLLDSLTRRARRRRASRMAGVLVAGVLSLASVMAGGALVTNKVLAHRDVPPAAQTEPSDSARPTPAPTHSGVALPPTTPRVRPDEGTDVQDLTWISTETGWALGFVLPNRYTVLHTTDGGETWDKIATLPSADAGSGPVELRFANKSNGYVVLNGHLSLSNDGGRSWLASALPGVVAVEAARSGAVVLTNASAGDALCSPCRVFHAPLGSRGWTKTLELPYDAAELRRSGQTVLATSFANSAGGASDKSAQVHRSDDGGLTWRSVSDPCTTVSPPGSEPDFATGLELAGSAWLAACQRFDPHAGSQDFMIVSGDGGQHFGPARDTPCGYSRFAIASATTAACPAQDGVHVTNDGGATWQLTLPAGGRAGADGCGFQTAEVGRCVRGVTVFTTRDAGRTWTARDVSAS